MLCMKSMIYVIVVNGKSDITLISFWYQLMWVCPNTTQSFLITKTNYYLAFQATLFRVKNHNL